VFSEIANTSYSELLRRVSLSYRFVPIQGEPFAYRAALTAPTYIRPGSTPVHNPSCALRGRGLQGGMGPFSSAAASARAWSRSHIHLGVITFSYRSLIFRSSAFEGGTLRDDACFKITPERHEQLACQRHDGDRADAAFRGTDTRPEPDAQIAVGLIAQPQSGEFDPGGSW
jgi:hypothetical protein